MIVSSIKDMLCESLPEMLAIAKYCYTAKKENGGVYGYPCATLLFNILDSIGSFYLNTDYEVKVDGKLKKIKNTSQYFYIINSEDYYSQNLSGAEIKILYDFFRSTLNNNLAMPPKCTLKLGEPSDPLFIISDDYPVLNLGAFLSKTETAVENFLKNIEKIVPGSRQENNIIIKKSSNL